MVMITTNVTFRHKIPKGRSTSLHLSVPSAISFLTHALMFVATYRLSSLQKTLCRDWHGCPSYCLLVLHALTFQKLQRGAHSHFGCKSQPPNFTVLLQTCILPFIHSVGAFSFGLIYFQYALAPWPSLLALRPADPTACSFQSESKALNAIPRNCWQESFPTSPASALKVSSIARTWFAASRLATPDFFSIKWGASFLSKFCPMNYL